jgi:hypothetical protein
VRPPHSLCVSVHASGTRAACNSRPAARCRSPSTPGRGRTSYDRRPPRPNSSTVRSRIGRLERRQMLKPPRIVPEIGDAVEILEGRLHGGGLRAQSSRIGYLPLVHPRRPPVPRT